MRDGEVQGGSWSSSAPRKAIAGTPRRRGSPACCPVAWCGAARRARCRPCRRHPSAGFSAGGRRSPVGPGHNGGVTTPSEQLAVAPEPGAELEPLDGSERVEPPRSWWRRLDKKLLVASLIIAIGLVLIGYGLSQSVTGDEASNMPDAVEEVTPAFDAIQVPQQTTIVADLESGYFGYLTVDGVELPTVRLDEVGRPLRAGQRDVDVHTRIRTGRRHARRRGAHREGRVLARGGRPGHGALLQLVVHRRLTSTAPWPPAASSRSGPCGRHGLTSPWAARRSPGATRTRPCRRGSGRRPARPS